MRSKETYKSSKQKVIISSGKPTQAVTHLGAINLGAGHFGADTSVPGHFGASPVYHQGHFGAGQFDIICPERHFGARDTLVHRHSGTVYSSVRGQFGAADALAPWTLWRQVQFVAMENLALNIFEKNFIIFYF